MATKQDHFMLKLTKFLPRLEMIFLAAVFMAVLLRRYDTKIGDMILMYALLALATIFFLSAFAFIEVREGDSPQGFRELVGYTIAPRVLGIASAAATMGILFTILKFEGADQMLLIGATSLGAGSLLLGVLIVSGLKHVNAVMPYLYRAVPLFIISVYILVAL